VKAMVLAAGFGTRLLPLTDYLPKQLLPVANRPVMHHLVNLLQRHGFTEVGVNVHHFAEAFQAYFGDGSALGVSIRWSEEEELLGTAGGVKRLEDYWDGKPILVTSGDGLHDVDLAAVVRQHERTGALATIVVKPVRDASQYGVVVTDRTTRIVGFQEKPPPDEAESNLASCGIYVLQPEVLEWIPDAEPADFGNDVFPALLRDGCSLHAFTTMSYWTDVGGLDDLRRASLDAVAGRVGVEVPGEQLEPGIHAEDGCTIDATATLEGPLAIGRNASIEGDAVVRGPCAIGAHARIGVGAAIRSAVLLPGCVIPDDGLAIAGIFGDASSLATSVLKYPAGSTQTWL
jgi:mannose-1-phosphate guanylyltransferase